MLKSGIVFASILRKRAAIAWSEKRAGGGMFATFSLGQSSLIERLSWLRQRAEDRTAARHPGDRWSDAVEREISKDWLDCRCGRRH
jgi:hypothetical protein